MRIAGKDVGSQRAAGGREGAWKHIAASVVSIDVERALPYNQPIGFFAQLVDIYSLDGAYYALFTYPDLHHSGIFPLTHISFTLRCNEAIVEGILNERRAEPPLDQSTPRG